MRGICIKEKMNIWQHVHRGKILQYQGQIQDFHGGGGGGVQKITHIMSAKPKVPYSQGPGACLRALQALWVVDALSAIWALFLSILIQNGIKKHSWSIFFWGGCLLRPPPPLNLPLQYGMLLLNKLTGKQALCLVWFLYIILWFLYIIYCFSDITRTSGTLYHNISAYVIQKTLSKRN